MDLSGHLGVIFAAILSLDLEIVEALPVATVVGQDRLIAMQFSLEDAQDRFGHGVVAEIPDGSDRGRHSV